MSVDCLWQVIAYLSFTTMEKHRQVVTVELNAVFSVLFLLKECDNTIAYVSPLLS